MNFLNELNDFLFFSYFGIDPQLCGDSEKTTKAVIECARIDASRHVHSFGDNNGDLVKRMNDSVNKLRGLYSEPFDNKQFDQWHYGVYVSLKQEDETITYGIAQKWINMTLKYLWLIGDEDITKIKSSLHVPVDRYILMAAVNTAAS